MLYHKPKVASPRIPSLLARDERLETLKIMAAQMAHDFNNFLAPVVGYIALIKENTSGNATVMQYLAAMETAARRAEGSLDDLLMALRPQRRFRPHLIEFDRLVDGLLTEWTASLPLTSRITVTQRLDPCKLVADEVQWKNVIQHLLKNARYALAMGGTLTVALNQVVLTEDEAADLGLNTTEAVKLTIHDTGFGIPPAMLSRVFDPFYTTRNKVHAQGLGLTIVHSVSRLHGGQVVIESIEESGTVVSIWLPLVFIEPPQEQVAPAPGPPIPAMPPAISPEELKAAKTKKILIVDDDPMIVEVVKALLAREHFDVVTARNGAEGIRLFKKHAGSIALILSDITMPEMDGVEMVEEIRRCAPQVKVVMMSGDADITREQKMSLFTTPCPPLIKKPFTLKALMELLRSQMQGSAP